MNQFLISLTIVAMLSGTSFGQNRKAPARKAPVPVSTKAAEPITGIYINTLGQSANVYMMPVESFDKTSENIYVVNDQKFKRGRTPLYLPDTPPGNYLIYLELDKPMPRVNDSSPACKDPLMSGSGKWRYYEEGKVVGLYREAEVMQDKVSAVITIVLPCNATLEDMLREYPKEYVFGKSDGKSFRKGLIDGFWGSKKMKGVDINYDDIKLKLTDSELNAIADLLNRGGFVIYNKGCIEQEVVFFEPSQKGATIDKIGNFVVRSTHCDDLFEISSASYSPNSRARTSDKSDAPPSTDKNRPTPLTSPEISGFADSKTPGNYYYSFTAGPGEIVMTANFDVAPGNLSTLGFMLGACLQGDDGKNVPIQDFPPDRPMPCLGFTGKEPSSETRFKLQSRQTVLLKLTTGGRGGSTGKYRLQFSGAVEFNNSSKGASSDKNNPTPLTSPEISGFADPKSGTEAYYSFVVEPGEVEVTLELENAKPMNGLESVGLNLAGYETPLYVLLRVPKEPRELRGIVILPKSRQRVRLHLSINPDTVGSGRYRVRISGATEFNKNR